MMKVAFFVRASVNHGFGHLIRSRTLANYIGRNYPSYEVDFFLIGDDMVGRFYPESPTNVIHVQSDRQLEVDQNYEIGFFDTTVLEEQVMDDVVSHVRLPVGLSPVFEHMNKLSAVFHRTKYIDESSKWPKKIFAGLEYAIIQEDCKKIPTYTYEYNLEQKNFPIAVSMGGGDAANLTLTFLRELKNCKVPATFWVMLGEGYQHSYDQLVEEVKKDSGHEIILAKTSQSMWHVLQNCVLTILPNGVTSFEAAYAGLPSINFQRGEGKEFLIKELIEKKVGFLAGEINVKNLNELNRLIEKLYHDRKILLEYHLNSKRLIRKDNCKRIFETCRKLLQAEGVSVH